MITPPPRRPHLPFRRGFLLFAVLFSILVLTILLTQFYQVSRQFQSTAFRFAQSEMARQIAESAMGELFMMVHEQLKDPSTPVAIWLLAMDGTVLGLDLPLTRREATSMVRSDYIPALKTTVKVCDFRYYDFDGMPFSIFSNEGVGTLELSAEVSLLPAKGGGKPVACRLIRQHDFKIATLVTPRPSSGPREGYTQNAALDYALLVRFGLEEFQNTRGKSLNQSDVRLKVVQNHLPPEKRGKIFFGGTSGENDRFVYLNLANDDPLPKAVGETFPASREECYELLPLAEAQRDDVLKTAEKLLEQHGGDAGRAGMSAAEARAMAIDHAEKQVEKRWATVKGEFLAHTAPVNRADYGGEEMTFEKGIRDLLIWKELNVSGDTGENSGDPFMAPGLQLNFSSDAAHPVAPETVFEGAIRQSFLYCVRFWVDFSGVDKKEAEKYKKIERHKMCFDFRPPNFDLAADQRFYERLPGLDSRRNPDKLLLSRFDRNTRYGFSGVMNASPKTFDQPVFYSPQGNRIDVGASGFKTGFQPFAGRSLFIRRFERVQQMIEAGILDPKNGLLNLHGIVQVREPLLFDRPLKIHGRGVIMAEAVKIAAGLQKETPSDLLILHSRSGNIYIDTSDPIEAALIAFNPNRNGMVVPHKPMRVKGAMIVDRLGTAERPPRWIGGDHHMEYDPLLKSDLPIISMNLVNWTNYYRIIDSAAENGF